MEIAPQYHYDNIEAKAEKLCEALEKRYGDIKEINFAGSDSDKDFLLWDMIFLLVNRLQWKSADIIGKIKDYFTCQPKRKDGSECWLRAFLEEDSYVSSLPKEVADFGEKLSGGLADPLSDNMRSIQVNSYATQQAGGRPHFWGDGLQQISRIAEIAKPKDIFGAVNEYDKTLIASFVEAGLVKVDHTQGDKISLLIPYLEKDEYEKLDKILLETEAALGEDFFVDYIEGYMKAAKKHIPDFLPDNEKNYVSTGITCINAVPYYLASVGKLRYPTDEEAKRLGIIIWKI